MKRNQFLKSIGISAAAIILAPDNLSAQQEKPIAYKKEIVQQFVGASHSNLDKVKEMLIEFPNLIYASNDWGGGDFETGIGAGGHVG